MTHPFSVNFDLSRDNLGYVIRYLSFRPSLQLYDCAQCSVQSLFSSSSLIHCHGRTLISKIKDYLYILWCFFYLAAWNADAVLR